MSRSPAPIRPRVRAAFTLALGAVFLAGCVTERVPAGGPPRAATRTPRSNAATAQLPGGPVAKPVLGGTSNSRVLVSIRPLGTVEYDGQNLPLVSPDGSSFAVAAGEAAAWDAVLARPGAAPPASTRIDIYRITEQGLERVGAVDGSASGLLLGRGGDSRGFLVEAVLPDGSRAIGRSPWSGGEVDWLVRDNALNAHAVVLPGGSIAYTRRSLDGSEPRLILRSPSGVESAATPADGRYLFPIATLSEGVIGVVGVDEKSVFIEARRISSRSGETSSARLGSVLTRRVLADRPDDAIAYQCVAPIAGSFAQSTSEALAAPVFFHPSLGRMSVLDLEGRGVIPLASASYAATPWLGTGSPGYLCSTPEGLYFTPSVGAQASPRRDATRPPDVRVLASRAVVRGTQSPDARVLLFGPSGDPRRLDVLELRPAPDAQ